MSDPARTIPWEELSTLATGEGSVTELQHDPRYDLRYEPWIPFLRRSRRVEWGAPFHITDGIAGDDPIVDLAAPRPDFNGALKEFLIGLLTVAMQVGDEDEWLSFWNNPPSPDQLRERLSKLPAAFFMDGDGPRFMQDIRVADFAESEILPIDRLLIDAPGEQSLELNKDLFVKRFQVQQMGAPSAAMALITLQTYSPSGGQGHRTSLRGGGPLTTIVLPHGGSMDQRPAALWSTLWVNAETELQWATRSPRSNQTDVALLFPWTGAPRTSEKQGGIATTSSDGHPLQCYFGTPRRIRLQWVAEGNCDVTGQESPIACRGFSMRPWGVQYEAWEHPLTPHYVDKKNGGLLPVHGQPGGLSWRDWLALTYATPDGSQRKPARVIAHFNQQRASSVGTRWFRLHAFGYDMDNMKARAWVESALPCVAVAGESQARLVRDTATRLMTGTDIAAGALISAVESAMFQNPKEARGDRSWVKGCFWAALEGGFYDPIRLAVDDNADPASIDGRCEAFHTELQAAALGIFDEQVSAAPLVPALVRRTVAARYRLLSTLRGYGKTGAKLLTALRLPLPEPPTARAASRATRPIRA